ncbi:hypothetical protein MKW92_045875 [Papaver armeniacum]|nr:hypothetical protein MKW92_045875 [Papaver armeniacum]
MGSEERVHQYQVEEEEEENPVQTGNIVLAQKSRERKKAYLTYLQVKVKELEKKNGELEERLSTLQNKSQMLRHVCIRFLIITHFWYPLVISIKLKSGV